MNPLCLTIVLVFIFAGSLSSQSSNCRLSPQTASLIKQRLLYQRQLYTKEQINQLVQRRSISYIPISFHSVSNVAGEGAATEKEIFAFLCGLNTLYADQNVQFFIHNQIHFRQSDAIDSDASSVASETTMSNWQIPGTINITIGRSINNQWASWYSYSDYIFLLKSMMSPQAKVEAHEIGHYFGLPHTFYGWEGNNAEAMYGGTNAPGSINGFPVERVSRTAGSNCATAGDGFCGTAADYFSARTNCPYHVTVKDPVGATLQPDDSNIMSYASDNCMQHFSFDQKAAIAIDIAQRTWVSNSPNGTTDLSAVAPPQALMPLNNALHGPLSDPSIRLEWTQLAGAPWHYVEVYGTIIPNVWLPNSSDVIYRGYQYNGKNYLDLPTSNLQENKFYAWRVTAISNYSTCAHPSSFNKFQASALITPFEDLQLEQQISFKLQQNPVQQRSIPLEVYAAYEVQGHVQIYALDGQLLLQTAVQQYQAGYTAIHIPTSQLSNSIYLAVFTTPKGVFQQKIVINRP